MFATCSTIYADHVFIKIEKAGTMPWKALKRLFEMQGIVLGYEDSTKLHRLIKVKGDNDMVNYKDALSHV